MQGMFLPLSMGGTREEAMREEFWAVCCWSSAGDPQLRDGNEDLDLKYWWHLEIEAMRGQYIKVFLIGGDALVILHSCLLSQYLKWINVFLLSQSQGGTSGKESTYQFRETQETWVSKEGGGGFRSFYHCRWSGPSPPRDCTQHGWQGSLSFHAHLNFSLHWVMSPNILK